MTPDFLRTTALVFGGLAVVTALIAALVYVAWMAVQRSLTPDPSWKEPS